MVLDGKTLNYEVVINKALKTSRLSVKSNKLIALHVPKLSYGFQPEAIIFQHKAWVLKQLARQPKRVLSENHEVPSVGKAELLRLISSELDMIYTQHPTVFNHKHLKLLIKNHKSLWGSCTTRRTLNFNAKLGYLPANLRHYIIVHEVCHLVELNHGKKFWELVASILPEYHHLRKELKGYAI